MNHKLRARTYTGVMDQEIRAYEIDNRQLAREAAADGMVLLKNEGKVLPVRTGSSIALYGPGAVYTFKGGSGSGDVNERESINIWTGLKNAGYSIVNETWLSEYIETYNKAKLEWRDWILEQSKGGNDDTFFNVYSTHQFRLPDGAQVDCFNDAAKCETAIYVIGRVAGEGADRHDVKGDYYLSDHEADELTRICSAFANVVIVVNSGGVMDLSFIDQYDSIKALIVMSQAGMEGGNALADIISGAVVPSGKLTSTWAYKYEDYPCANTFSYKNGNLNQEYYNEGIFVGYRYFDAFGIRPRYCFGYGLSYTTFNVSMVRTNIEKDSQGELRIAVTVNVQNTGTEFSGREVVQIYMSCPQGRLVKEYKRLSGYAKTRSLAPGESQQLTISFPAYQLASYDTELPGWILEKGSYGVWIGSSAGNCRLSSAIELDNDAIMVRTEHICSPQSSIEEMEPDYTILNNRDDIIEEKMITGEIPVIQMSSEDIVMKTIQYHEKPEHKQDDAGRITEQLTLEQCIKLVVGDPGKSHNSMIGSAGLSVPGSAGETSTAASDHGIGTIVMSDGPAGIRLQQHYDVVDGKIVKKTFIAGIENGLFDLDSRKEGDRYYQYCTAFPVGTLLAQTWDRELLERVGHGVAVEMEIFDTTLWLAPGMNIHRNPLCGRNFEYFSEDPLLSGSTGGAITLGVQSCHGTGTTIKHFACNNEEDNRVGCDSILSERTLREIYLKGFEIAVKDSQPMSIMTSYNLINGIHSANNYDICMKVARDEWGFAGMIMTDWCTTQPIAPELAPCSTAEGCMMAFNNLIMPGFQYDMDHIRAAVEEGSIEEADVRLCAEGIVRTVLQSGQYDNAVAYREQFEGLGSYLKVH